MKMSKFWRFKTVKNKIDEENESTENVLFLNGVIAEESWYSDDVTPKMFRDELNRYAGDITVWINSPGGDCFAASEIYTALKEHNGKITVKITNLFHAISAAAIGFITALALTIAVKYIRGPEHKGFPPPHS